LLSEDVYEGEDEVLEKEHSIYGDVELVAGDI